MSAAPFHATTDSGTPSPPAASATTVPSVAESAATPRPTRSAKPVVGPCAHSLAVTETRDARDRDALSDCRFEHSGHDAIGDKCAAVAHAVSLDRLDRAVMPFSPAVVHRLRKRWALGQKLARRGHVFGLIGDSITASPKFMTPIGSISTISASVRTRLALSTPGQATDVVAHYRGMPVVAQLDSFRAPRAAKVGATSSWALPAGVTPIATPIGRLIRTHSPAIVVLLYGSNDAATRFVDHRDLIAGFEERMGRIIDELEDAGVIVVLNTVPRHMFDPARRDCDGKPGDLSNWRMAVQTSAVSAVAARLACDRNLPLIDLRHAFDALLNHGIGPDGVHPNAHPRGAGRLDAEGLRCGYNVRNYVTLRMLKQVLEALQET